MIAWVYVTGPRTLADARAVCGLPHGWRGFYDGKDRMGRKRWRLLRTDDAEHAGWRFFDYAGTSAGTFSPEN